MGPPLPIRSATPDDAAAIAALIAGFQPLLTLDPGGAGAEAYLASVSEAAERGYLCSPRYRFLVAEDPAPAPGLRAPGLAGFVALRDGSHLFHLFVAADRQRQGLARRLWQQAQAEALQAGEITAFTVNASLAAVAVYQRFGFVPSAPVARVHGIAFQPMVLPVAAP